MRGLGSHMTLIKLYRFRLFFFGRRKARRRRERDDRKQTTTKLWTAVVLSHMQAGMKYIQAASSSNGSDTLWKDGTGPSGEERAFIPIVISLRSTLGLANTLYGVH
ncbi:hypothetical protein MGYG_00517 [Nannizzia gypsea CBS 118893]|uniref:Uncharacterized protein n=1 Tax=Arthroderma gypseum (strain ATCC MYA-4604 / CBS 118893) TaxID=535722 RepID=E5R066_ARTGP|nr:hypothetical protein MGYG_00517 [Nannizzia gypsea CBS 118893]EFQ97477.1 hypothetical protein MGYG_00517 [Nannizzia gypsea CBS 118893]